MKRSSAGAPAVATVLSLVLFAAGARADDDALAAKALFDAAHDLAASGDWATACAKLEESVALVRDMNALYRLGECDEHIGKTASAWRRFLEAADVATKANDKARAKAARAHASALEAHVPKLTIEVDDTSPSLVVVRDGTIVTAEERGVAVPLDPGEHTVEARAPGKKGFFTTITLGEAPWARSVRVPVLEALPAPPTLTPTPTPTPTKAATKAETPPTSTATSEAPRRSLLGPVLIAVGGGALITGGALALVARSKYHDADPSCVGGCDSAGEEATRSAQRWGNAATVFSIVGVVGVATGVVVWITAPSGASPPSVAIGVDARGVSLHGSF